MRQEICRNVANGRLGRVDFFNPAVGRSDPAFSSRLLDHFRQTLWVASVSPLFPPLAPSPLTLMASTPSHLKLGAKRTSWLSQVIESFAKGWQKGSFWYYRQWAQNTHEVYDDQLMKHYLAFLAILLLTANANACAAEGIALSADSFTLKFTAEGQPESCVRKADGAELLPKGRPGEGFFLKGLDGAVVRLSSLSLLRDGHLIAANAEGSKQVRLAVTHGPRHIAFRIESAEGIAPEQFESLHFGAVSNPQLRVLGLDYMTRADSRSYGVFVDWPEFWHRSREDTLGGFVLYETTGDDDEDDTLLRLWVTEKLPHPKVSGEWTLDRARAWIGEWQRRFADRTQMILAGQSLAELREGLEFASRAGIRQIYLFTDTWRPDKFWPVGEKNWEVNTNVFPRGEADLRGFADAVRSKGMYLALHYLSGGIGMKDPQYVGQKPDRRLASWGTGTIAKAVGAIDTTIPFLPAPGVELPSVRRVPFPKESEWNWMRLGDEIIRFASIEPQADGVWLLKGCGRAVGSTLAVAHPAGEEAAGLFASYGQNFMPGNDTTLLREMAENYGGLLNRCLIEHAEFDGAEIHANEGFWGYRKFATCVYEALDHPTSTHDSTGSRADCWLEYRLNSSKRLMQGSCAYTHGNYGVSIVIASPSRPASTLLDAHFFLSQGNLGGALGIAKPEPMFGVTPVMLKAHGLTGEFVAALAAWKEVCVRLTPGQRTQINSTFAYPKGERFLLFNHHLQSPVVPVARKVGDRYEVVPTRVLTRKSGDILWQNGQEHGPISPRQLVQPGEPIALENPDAAQPVQFIMHVLPAFDFNTEATLTKPGIATAPRAKTATEIFTGGNAAAPATDPASARNFSLQPTSAQMIRAAGPTVASMEGDALILTASNPSDKMQRETEQLPTWSVAADLTARRGLGMWVTGDRSGALLLIMVGSRDYIVPLDFEGRRYVEIPNGEVSWSRSDWGWRMETKSNDYGHVRQVKIGFGELPPHCTASVRVERLTALGEALVELQNPVVHVDQGQVAVHGAIPSGHFLQYDGGDRATVFDEN